MSLGRGGNTGKVSLDPAIKSEERSRLKYNSVSTAFDTASPRTWERMPLDSGGGHQVEVDRLESPESPVSLPSGDFQGKEPILEEFRNLPGEKRKQLRCLLCVLSCPSGKQE